MAAVENWTCRVISSVWRLIRSLFTVFELDEIQAAPKCSLGCIDYVA
ncbi:hypothetical protein CCACVL1_03685 [Corchorus capsularis]|uniref:Uncharacterized protein n=1 Tax=Corchorus capsularis TaxID=210143 RepID=A0A1R3JXZ1_COCAP|nr:hypothetical protein CCACVL1_03685 [Corchorus capsularis]